MVRTVVFLMLFMLGVACGKKDVADNDEFIVNLQPVQLASGMQFTEGPAWCSDGYLLFSDINGNTIYKWSEQAGVETFLNPSGNANGLACNGSWFVVCRHGSRDVATLSQLGSMASLVSDYEGKRLNSPNDLVISDKGNIYFTDPDYGVLQQNRELDFEGLYFIAKGTSKTILLDRTLNKPNGVALSADGNTLFLCESSSNIIYRYDIGSDNLTHDRKVFAHVAGVGEVDGITCDAAGNLYVAFGDGGLVILNKSGNQLVQVPFPAKEKVRNLCFGGVMGSTLFITAGQSLYKIEF